MQQKYFRFTANRGKIDFLLPSYSTTLTLTHFIESQIPHVYANWSNDDHDNTAICKGHTCSDDNGRRAGVLQKKNLQSQCVAS